jgi:two-component system, cell cycle sensor histidine kinase and response regulator CckA
MHLHTSVLVVDDNADTRDAVAALLRDAGHKTTLANTGSEALVLFECTPELEIVIADIVMPGMSGFELARHVKAVRPKTAVLLMTGYADYVDAVVNIGAVPLLKPFSASTLRRVVQDSLDAARAPA